MLLSAIIFQIFIPVGSAHYDIIILECVAVLLMWPLEVTHIENHTVLG